MTQPEFTPSPLASVRYENTEYGPTVVFVRDLAHPVEKVWAALSDHRQLSGWAPFTTDTDLTGTGPVTLTMIDGPVREDMRAEVLLVEPPHLLEYRWGTDVLRWELTEQESGTRLTLRHATGDGDWAAKLAAGWHLCLDVADRLLAGQPVEPIRGQDARDFGWDELNAAYERELGINASG